MKNMSRQDDAGLMGQGMVETPRTDKARAEYVNHICKVVPIEVARQLERELNQAVKERDEWRELAQRLREREIQTGQPISGEDWEIAGYAVGDEHKHS